MLMNLTQRTSRFASYQRRSADSAGAMKMFY